MLQFRKHGLTVSFLAKCWVYGDMHHESFVITLPSTVLPATA